MGKTLVKVHTLIILSIAMFVCVNTHANWGANYFPNTALTTHEGRQVKFFDDLLKDKIVVVNFIYTTCPDVCPLETAQLVKVQEILGDRLGKDIFFYSITIDPEHDSVEVLKKYREQFGAKWDFHTGKRTEIKHLRKKLGLYIDGADDGPNKNNHNVSMIIGNQKTGRWMKRSPFENPYVLADQIGNWLDGWKSPQKVKDYANAPKLRNMSNGEPLFRTRCASCHSVSGVQEPNAIGPDLVGVTQRRDKQWLIRWLQAPDKMIAEKDPIAIALLKQWKNLPMPNLRLNKKEALDLLDYLESLNSENVGGAKVDQKQISKQADKLAVMNAWVREAHPNATVNAGYMTLINAGGADVEIASASSKAFEKVEFHEMAMVDGMMEMRELKGLIIASGDQLKFEPGGKHLMMKEPKQAIKAGQVIDIVLTFKDGSQQTLSVKVKKDI
ncbi:MAG: copper chaperone PCu(A)C [Agarilytica sp.]